jgi:hypothetical protein
MNLNYVKIDAPGGWAFYHEINFPEKENRFKPKKKPYRILRQG